MRVRDHRRPRARHGAATVLLAAALHAAAVLHAAAAAVTPPTAADARPAPAVSAARIAPGTLRTVRVAWPGHDFAAWVHVWRHAEVDSTAPASVLYVMAGRELFDAHAAPDREEWGLDEFLAAGADGIPPLLVVAVEPGADALRDLAPPGSRTDGRGAAYAQFLTGTVKPYIDAHWRTRPDAASNWIAGEGAGGAFAVYVAWTAATVFGAGIALGMPAPDRDLPAWCAVLPAPPGPRLWVDRVTDAVDASSTTAIDAALGRGAQLQIRQAGPQVARIVRLAAALRFAARP